ncbi:MULTISPECIES: OmpA family protein [Vibrio]|jgi:outer membrane protein OmpA-like peptidoglycan-associated protein|uniref:OmpA family protein n=5 Tax=Vibrio harveyi group TaxID=717610 RepID=A0A0H0YBZ6_VIBAL|nr:MULTISPECIES: OmpA family protein [Vibrio]EEZ81374.1 outer membrane protein, putative [Vibrio alginolyticus 40B]MDG2625004.1 OmpA family protein [Vibrio parahaemolyticus]MDW1968732.1 OmpA family protein [Vibrio sp. 945]MDW2260701.1 OmpA family protein [Vibrio sp. 1409]MDW2297753.1 OmpA family protein [Vibrio sp. 1404]NAW53821.1 OmpA family protein [Vibrio sp. V41_P2S12T139]NAW95423.1 OmpA family protein [Vibrio sp. V42_P2S4T144]QCO86124.1 OmpA family protein [Vibrio neocaledonicus]QIR88
MKPVKILFALGMLAITQHVVAEDEYEYRPVPNAEQIADLQDDDNDGVINARDMCPGTPEGSEVDNDGCGEYIKASDNMQVRILFANDSDEINPVFRRQVRELSDFLKEYPTTSIELHGYASKVGGSKHNQDLSERRARNVREALLSYDIEPSRVRIVGFGDTHLAQQGTDEVSHALNRRVTASVVGYKGEIKREWTIFTTLPER